MEGWSDGNGEQEKGREIGWSSMMNCTFLRFMFDSQILAGKLFRCHGTLLRTDRAMGNSVNGKGEQCSLCRGRPRPRRRTCYTRAPSGSIGMRPLGVRAGRGHGGVRLAFNIPPLSNSIAVSSPSLPPSLFLSYILLAHSLARSFRPPVG